MKKKVPVPAEDTDERVRKSEQAVLRATFQLLTKAELTGLSVDVVAKRSGVAKTNITTTGHPGPPCF